MMRWAGRRRLSVWPATLAWLLSTPGTLAVGQELGSDTWVATDALARSLPMVEDVGPPRAGKFVGLFYFLWLGQAGDLGPFDIAKILAQDPGAIRDPHSPRWGPLRAPHHWGESIFGYYVSDDESVLWKHGQMLGDAGVDVLFFDVTNQVTYPQSWKALCRVFEQMRRLGNRVPQIAFLCPFGDPGKVVRELWDQLYGQNLHADLWFRWEGKPLILADPAFLGAGLETGRHTMRARLEASQALGQRLRVDQRDEQIRRFFTFRKPQPDYFRGPTGREQWGWLEVYPQHAFYKGPAAAEEVAVGVAQNAADGKLSVFTNPRSHGRSFHKGTQPGPDGRDASGLNFAEQWRRALELDPQIVFVTGWNEWIAGRFNPATMPLPGTGPVAFVDEFDAEFSRDIEPMKGGHQDNYYYQLVANIRRFKGARSIPLVQSRPIAIDGRFDDWASVFPEYRDTTGDPVRRDHRGWGKSLRYVNSTGRNDIVAAKVSIGERAVSFYARTQIRLTSCDGPNWMLLFIDADGNPKTGWLGYDLLVNRNVRDVSRTVVERNIGGSYAWGSPTELPYRATGNELELSIPHAIFGGARLPPAIDFKWADNIQQTGDWSDFTVNGDAAPNDRFNYRARFQK
jgi:hypothetical protein